MLKDAMAILAMLKEQKAALESEAESRLKRDDDLIATIKADGVAFQEPLMAMVHNLDLAIRKIEGGNGEVTHG